MDHDTIVYICDTAYKTIWWVSFFAIFGVWWVSFFAIFGGGLFKHVVVNNWPKKASEK